MDLYAYHDRHDEALAIFKGLFSKNQEFSITPMKSLSLATSLLKGDRTDDVFQVLEHLKLPTENSERMKIRDTLEIAGWRLLNVAALKGDVQLTRKILDVLEKSEIKITSMLASPLIKAYLTRYFVLSNFFKT